MQQDLVELRISIENVERLTGFEVNEIFIGGLLGGVYRPSIFRKAKRLLEFCVTEMVVLVITFIFALPFGFLVIRNSTNAIDRLAPILQFLQIPLGITVTVIISWNIYMFFKVKTLQTLAHLLDDVDKYNEVIQAVEVLDRLEAIGNPQAKAINRYQVLEALKIARSSLISGLMTERILRENRSLLARRYDLFANIENNLATLRTIEVSNQANEYAELLNQALQIGMSVYQEVQSFSQSK